MTQNYINGFFTKCAEHKVPYDLAVAMYKQSQAASAPSAQAPGFFAERLAPVVSPIKGLVGNAARRATAQAVMSRRPTHLAKGIDDQARMHEFFRTGKMPGNDAVKKIRGILAGRRAKKALAPVKAVDPGTPSPGIEQINKTQPGVKMS